MSATSQRQPVGAVLGPLWLLLHENTDVSQSAVLAAKQRLNKVRYWATPEARRTSACGSCWLKPTAGFRFSVASETLGYSGERNTVKFSIQSSCLCSTRAKPFPIAGLLQELNLSR